MDHFTLLGLPPCPHIDPKRVQEIFHRLSMKFHPDHFHQQSEEEKKQAHERYTQLNLAAQTLSNPVKRLEYLIQLKRPQNYSHTPSPTTVHDATSGLVDTLMEIGLLCQNVDRFMIKKDQADSPMVKVHLFKEGMQWKSKLDGMNEIIEAETREINDQLKELNAVWLDARERHDEGKSDAILTKLEDYLQMYKSLNRASEQIKERQIRLFF